MNTAGHIVEVGDPDVYTAFCLKAGCCFRVTNQSRAKLMAASYRHIADVLDPPEKVAE